MSIYLSDGNNRLKKLAGRLNTIDNALDPASKNPVQNKTLYNPVTFAETERQKSKNLLGIKNKSQVTEGGLTYSCVDGVVTINGTSTGKSLDIPLHNIQLIADKNYVLSAIKGGSNNDGSAFLLYTEPSTPFSEMDLRYQTSKSVTVTSDTTVNALSIWCGPGISFTDYTLKFQLEEGLVATDYQPYNGAIVHEKDIADVEHIETIYDVNTKNIVNDVAYTSGLGNGSYNMDFSKYKKIICYLFRPMSSQVVDLQQLDIDDDTVYRSRNCSDARYVTDRSVIYMYSSNITVSSTKDILNLEYKWSTGGGEGGDIGGIYKIEGVY